MRVFEIKDKLDAERGNKQYVKQYYETIIGRLNAYNLNANIFNPNAQEVRDIPDAAWHFFTSNSCIYAFLAMLNMKEIIKVCNDKLYLYNDKYNYWEIQESKSETLIKIKELLEEIYEINFANIEAIGIRINSKISTLINDLKFDKRFRISDSEFKQKVAESSDWINFKNCCYNIETRKLITNKEERKKLFFDSYIDANYLYEKIREGLDKNINYDIKDDMKYFLHFRETSLNDNWFKFLQIGQHLVYSICTKSEQRKAKQVLLMLGEHDVGKSCLIDLFTSYFPLKLVSNLSPTVFKTTGARAKLFNVKLNATHETSSEKNLPVSEFNKTVWINLDQAVVNNKIYRGDYLQLHQVYAANQFFKAKEQYNPKDYLPKINLLLVDGKPKEKINDLSAKIVAEKDTIITYFVGYSFQFEEKYYGLYEKLKIDNFNFIEIEDAIEFKNEIQAVYDEEKLMKNQKKEKKLDTSVLDYGVDQFLKEKIDFYSFDDNFLDNIKSYTVEQAIKLILAKVPDENRILFDDMYNCYANYCYEKDIEAYTSSMFKKKINGILKGNLLIESKIKSGKEIINYKNQYKKIIENERQLVVYKKFKNKSTGENKIGYIGIKVL